MKLRCRLGLHYWSMKKKTNYGSQWCLECGTKRGCYELGEEELKYYEKDTEKVAE